MSESTQEPIDTGFLKFFLRALRGFLACGAAVFVPIWCLNAYLDWSRTVLSRRPDDAVGLVISLVVGLPFIALMPFDRRTRLKLGVFYVFAMSAVLITYELIHICTRFGDCF